MALTPHGLASEAAPRRLARPAVTAMGTALLVLGLGFALSPGAALVLIAAAGFVAAVMPRPFWGFIAVLLVQVVSPLYLSVSVLPALPPFPLSLIVLAATATIVLARTPASERMWSHPVTIAYLAYGMALVLSLALSTAPSATINGWVRCFGVPMTAYLMTWRLVRTPRDAILTLDALLLGAVIISVYGMVEFAIGWNPLIEKLAEPTGESGDLLYWDQRESSGNVYRSFSVEMNPLFFGATVSMLFPYAVARFGLASGVLGKAVFGLAALLCFGGVATTFSRGPLVALLVAAIGLAIVFPPIRRLVLAALACAVLVGVSLLPWLSDEIWERFSDPDNVAIRLKLWQLAGWMFVDNPVTGVGLNGFADHQIAVLRAYEVGPFPEHSLGELESLGTADGTFPQLAAETGIAGVAAFLALFGVAAARVVRCLRHPAPSLQVIAASVGVAACVYLVNGLTITVYTAYTPTVILAVMLALVAALDHGEETDAAPQRDSS